MNNTLLLLVLALPYPMIENLGSEQFVVRERASQGLEQIGYFAIEPCAVAARNHPDIEVRTRCRRIVAHWESRQPVQVAKDLEIGGD